LSLIILFITELNLHLNCLPTHTSAMKSITFQYHVAAVSYVPCYGLDKHGSLFERRRDWYLHKCL